MKIYSGMLNAVIPCIDKFANRHGRKRGVVAVALSAISTIAGATPITLIGPGYWLENIGTNSLGIVEGPRTIFYASSIPGGSSGTAVTANYSGVPTYAPDQNGASGWFRTQSGPLNTLDLGPLSVVFANGADTTTFTGRSLVGVSLMPFATGLAATGNPFSPVISWSLPNGPGIDIDRVQLVFYSTVTQSEIFSRVNLNGAATSFALPNLPPDLKVTVNIRVIDQFDDAGNFSDTNLLSQSRTYLDFATPVPEPETYAMMLSGLCLLGFVARRRK